MNRFYFNVYGDTQFANTIIWNGCFQEKEIDFNKISENRNADLYFSRRFRGLRRYKKELFYSENIAE